MLIVEFNIAFIYDDLNSFKISDDLNLIET